MTKKRLTLPTLLGAAALFTSGCGPTLETKAEGALENQTLIGAWRGKIQFTTGSYSTIKDLEFMYVFNAGGTMTESSNYDSSPPVPPAYGAWRQTAPRQYEARYSFFSTKPPAGFDDIAKGGGWSPSGHGVLHEKITVSEDGKSFHSTLKYDAFDPSGKPTESGSEARVQALRIGL